MKDPVDKIVADKAIKSLPIFDKQSVKHPFVTLRKTLLEAYTHIRVYVLADSLKTLIYYFLQYSYLKAEIINCLCVCISLFLPLVTTNYFYTIMY